MAHRNSSSGTYVAGGARARAPSGRIREVECPPPPACPACGGLECLCRPHFFAGQLLTEDDLNRLERYVVAKNKLHNRHLHGWGVVCGLEVLCDPCGEGVLVKPGHALAPCGEDIVVCAEEPVDVCALIEACRPRDDHGCQPGATPAPQPRPRPNEPCDDPIERWVLAICYDERPSRGVTPLRQPPESCGCGKRAGCNCGGAKSGGGCGCGGGKRGGGCTCATGARAKNGAGTYASRGAAAVACEPTLICEGYRFIAYRAPRRDPVKDPGNNLADRGPLIERVLCCWRALVERLERVPADTGRLARWQSDTKAAVIDVVTELAAYDCGGVVSKLRALPLVDRGTFTEAAYRSAVASFGIQLASLAAQFLRDCLCKALLPPCPPPAECNCVPLATIEVRRADCRIVDVCNWGPRKLALTFPQLQYWLSPLQLGDVLNGTLERICCTTLAPRSGYQLPGRQTPPLAFGAGVTTAPPAPAPAPAPAAVASQPTNPAQEAARLIAESFANQGRNIDATTWLLDSLGFLDEKSNGGPILKSHERTDPVVLLLANQLVQPFVSALRPQDPAEKTEELRLMVDDLRRRVDEQAHEITQLRNQRRRED